MTEDELVLKAMNVLNTKVENLKQKNMLLEADNNQKDQLIGELKQKKIIRYQLKCWCFYNRIGNMNNRLEKLCKIV